MKYNITPKGAAYHAAYVAGYTKFGNEEDHKTFESFWNKFEENLHIANISFNDSLVCGNCKSKERYDELYKATQVRTSIFGSLLGISLGINLVLLCIIFAPV